MPFYKIVIFIREHAALKAHQRPITFINHSVLLRHIKQRLKASKTPRTAHLLHVKAFIPSIMFCTASSTLR